MTENNLNTDSGGVNRSLKKALLFFGSVILIIASGYISVIFLLAINKNNDNYSETKLETGTPDFSTIEPNNKSLSDLGGWTLISPPGKDRVYAYVDTINDIKINVSQQPLPEDFKTDTDKQIEDLAKSFNASTVLDVNGVKIYIGSSTDGPQSVIFTKSNLLILIKSTAKISNDQWVEYIKSLN